MSLISIIMPVYNSEKYLNRAIDSVLKQTYSNLELILVNDGSTDKSEEIIKKYDDKRIVLISQENKGQAQARNTGLKIAKGEYITFIDSDDEYCNDVVIEKGINRLTKDDSDVVIFGFNYVDNDGIKKEIHPFRKEIINLKDDISIIQDYSNCLWDKIYRKEVFEGQEFQDVVQEDMCMGLCIVKNMTKLSFIDEPLINYYYEHNDSVSNTINKKIESIFMACDYIRNQYIECDAYSTYKKQLDAVFSREIMEVLRKVVRNNCDFKDEFINKTYDYFKTNNLKPIDNNKNAIFYRNKMTLKLYRIIKGL